MFMTNLTFSSLSSQTMIVTCGFWGNICKVFSMDTLSDVGCFHQQSQTAQIVCIIGDEENSTIFTGDSNGIIKVWLLYEENNHNHSLRFDIIHTLCGHVDPITSMSLASELDIIVSGDTIGNICVHTVTSGEYIRTIEATKGDDGGACDLLQIAPAGCILAHHWKDLSLVTYWLNGQQLRRAKCRHRILCMAVNGDSNLVVCGRADGTVEIRDVYNLEVCM